MNGPKVFFLRDELGHRVACIVSQLQNDGIHYALSVYDPSDTFDVQMAKGYALARLFFPRDIDANYCGVVPVSGNVKGDILQHIANSLKVPHRARAAARLWLKQVIEANKAALAGKAKEGDIAAIQKARSA